MRGSRGIRAGAAAPWVLALLVALIPSALSAQGTLTALQTDVDQIARRARPSVVTVFAQRQVPGARTTDQRTRTRVGSGFAVAEDIIATTASVVLGADRLMVRASNGLQVEGELIGLDPIFNVAVVRVPTLRLPALRFGNAGDTEVGDWVVSLGTSYRAQATQSVGNVAYRYSEPHQTLLQLTNTVYPGNSGAAALNPRGELIGIVQGELGSPELENRDPEGERRPGGVSFALPVESLRPVLESLRRDGRLRHGFLGVSTRALTLESDREGGARTPLGALVENVVPGGPAEQAGLRGGDLIVAFERERVEYPEQLARWVAATPPGKAIELVWVREETRMEGRSIITESPGPMPRWIAREPDSDVPEAGAARITELEKEVRRLSDELQRLKDKPKKSP
jgi:S1-C subfamily serine protease